MSSYAAFCSICCRAALCAFATSASLRTGGEPSFFHCVFNSSNHQITRKGRQPRQRKLRCTRIGTVLSAAEPCWWLNASPPLNCFSDLHPVPAGAQHEPTSSYRITLGLQDTHSSCASSDRKSCVDPRYMPLHTPDPPPTPRPSLTSSALHTPRQQPCAP